MADRRATHALILGCLTRLDEALVQFYLTPTTDNWTDMLACKLQFTGLFATLSEENARFDGQVSAMQIAARQGDLFKPVAET